MNTIKNILSENMQQLGMIEALSIRTVLAAMAVALVCSLMIYITYRFFYKGAAYSESFGILLILLALVTAFIIICISTNLVLSLGMVGALSIVRFRAAVKEPLDVGFLFFAIAAGLTCGARLYFVALTGTVAICFIFSLCCMLLTRKQTYLLVVRYGDEAADALEKALASRRKKLKSRIRQGNITEITYAVSIKDNAAEWTNALNEIKGVENVVLVQYAQEV